jgi:hypothetical protein
VLAAVRAGKFEFSHNNIFNRPRNKPACSVEIPHIETVFGEICKSNLADEKRRGAGQNSPVVAQDCILRYRGFPIRRPLANPASENPAPSRLEIGDTADLESIPGDLLNQWNLRPSNSYR